VYQPVRCVPALAALLALAAGAVGCGARPTPVEGSASDGLAFARLFDGVEDLVRARVSDGAEVRLTATPARRERWPTWSDAASALAFETLAVAPNARSDLVLWHAEDGSETPLTETRARSESWATWSPVGRRIAYAYRGGSPSGGIAVRDLDQPVARSIARVGEEELFIRPHFDPAGRRIVAQRKVPRAGSHLWIVGPRLRPRPLTRDPAWFDLKGWFSRDGARIVYTRWPTTEGPQQIVSIDAEGNDLRVLGGGAGDADDSSARPSPTRDEVVFVSNRDGSPDLYLADLDGSAARRLTRSPDQSEYAPAWSPDGERIVATVTPTREGRPRLTDPEGLADARVVVFDRSGRQLFEAPGFMPSWMPPWP
jgi:Tol biopolymer transport system component